MAKITVHGGPSNAAADEHTGSDVVEERVEEPSASATSAVSPEAAEAAPEELAVKAAPRRRTRSKS